MLRKILPIALLGLFLAGPATAALNWEILASDATQLRLRVTVEDARLVEVGDEGWHQVQIRGAHQTADPGMPLLPRAARWVAIPPEGEVVIESRILDRRSLGGARLQPHPIAELDENALADEPRLREVVRPEEGYTEYRSVESSSIGLGSVVFQRRQRMVPIQFSPVLYDAASGRIELVTSAEIVVRFPDYGGISRESRRLPAAIGGGVLNPGQAAQWRCLAPDLESRRDAWSSGGAGPIRSLDRRADGILLFDPAQLRSDEIRVRVPDSELVRVRVSDLLQEHGLPAGTLRQDLRLYQKRRSEYDSPDFPTPVTVDVPLHFVGSPPQDQPISPDDELVFYGFSVMGDSLARDLGGSMLPPAMPIRPDHYNSTNVYFLAAMAPGSGPWARMAVESVGPSQGNPEPSFRQVQRFTGDTGYQDNPINPDVERYHWSEWNDAGVTRVVPLFDPAPGTTVNLGWSAVGYIFDEVRNVTFYVEGRAGRIDLQTVNMGSRVFRTLTDLSGSVPADDLESGFLTFGMELLLNGNSATLGMFLGHIAVDYQALYRSRRLNQTSFNDATFTAGRAGVDVDLEVSGFSRQDVLLFDLTDPRNPRAIALTPQNFRAETDGSTTLLLRVPQTAGELRHFRAATLGRLEFLRDRNLESDPVARVFDVADNLQVLAVGPAQFESTMQDWVQWRQDHDVGYGWNVGYVDVQQIYDDFSGGLQSPHAIKDFAEYAYLQWGAQALVLVGDANEDARGVGEDAGSNHVPPSLHLQTFDETELLASDKWYGFFGANENYPNNINRTSDLLVGRLAVADVPMLESVLAKIFAYEQPRDADEWRKRSFWMADDAWSTSYLGAGGGSYRYVSSEDEFGTSQDLNAGLNSASLDSIQVGEFYNIDEVTSACRNDVGCTTVSCTISCFQNRGQARLLERLNQGWLIVSYQGHAAFNRLAHESIMLGNAVSSLSNQGRPFLFFGMGCHVTDFLQYDEGRVGRPIGELLFALPERGAIATYGSSGFEFLRPNATFMETITANFFDRGRTTGMVGGSELRGQWLLGEIMAQSELDVLGLFGVSNKDEMVAQYNLLGDPLLRMDAAPPRLRARGAGGPVQDGGDLVADDGATTSAISLELLDENGTVFEVSDSRGRDYTAQVQVIDESDPRRISAQLDLPVYPQNYTLDLVLLDGIYPEARSTSLTLRVTLDYELFVDGEPFDTDGLPVGVRLPAELRITSPVDLLEEDIGPVTLTGGTIENFSASGSQRSWTLTFDVTAESAEEQALQVSLAGVVEEIPLLAPSDGSADLVIEEHYPMPNPASMSTGQPLYVVARANATVEWARLTVYDLSGRLVYDKRSSVSAALDDDFSFAWDGRALDGAEVANGTYFYRIEAGVGSRRARSDMGRIVVMR